MIPRITITRDLIDALREWNKRQKATRLAYYAGPTSWCWMPGCFNAATRYCRGHGNQKIRERA